MFFPAKLRILAGLEDQDQAKARRWRQHWHVCHVHGPGQVDLPGAQAGGFTDGKN